MKSVNQTYAALNSSLSQEPRYTLELAFDYDNTDLVYFTSHHDGRYPSGGTVLSNVISDKGLSGTTQKLSPFKGAATIGTITAKLIDSGEAITKLINGRLSAGYGLKGKRVRVYRGFYGQDWAVYELFQTQIVETVTLDKGVYTIKCADIQRSQRQQIFELNSTTLTASIGADDTLIPVANYSTFEMLQHGTSYADAPSSTVGYIKIDDEVIRYSGTTDDGTLGPCFRVDNANSRGRGALGTLAAEHSVDTNASTDRGTKVEEFIYLELPLVKLAYAILTGSLYGDEASLPDNWHLNISTDYVKTSEFIQIGRDWWDTSDDTAGRIGRFSGLDSTDGKKFLETEVYQLLGAFSPVLADGSLGLRRMTRVLYNASAAVELGKDDIVRNTALVHDMGAVANQLQINWNYDFVKDETTRSNLLIDSDSISMHGASPVTKLTFLGLHGSRHTQNTLYEHFDTLRDRYAGPPQRMSITLLGRNHDIEIGDIVRLNHPDIQDFVTGVALNRSFEVQNIKIDWTRGLVTLDLFGSSQSAGVNSLATASVMDDAFYSAEGTDIATLAGVSDVGGVLHVTADLDLSGTVGGNDLADAGSMVFADGDLEIDAGVTLTTSSNTQIRVKGHLQVNGLITSAGNGFPGGASGDLNLPADPGVTTYGSTQSQGGAAGSFVWLIDPYRGASAAGADTALPVFSLSNPDGSGIDGLPDSLCGTGGPSGGVSTMTYIKPDIMGGGVDVETQQGGAGGAGGGGILIICRGLDIGGSGAIATDGEDGSQGSAAKISELDRIIYSGSGGGGHAGGLVILLDGNITYPTGLSRFQAVRGAAKSRGTKITSQGKYKTRTAYSSGYEKGAFTTQDNSSSMLRVQYIPEPLTAQEDVPTTSSAPSAIKVKEYANTPQTPAQNLASLEVSVTAPSDSTYSHAEIYYKLPTQTAWISAGPADSEAVVTVPMDGTTYDVRAVPVSIFGEESDEYIETQVTVSNQTGGVNLSSGNYIAHNKTGYSDDTSVGFWLGVDGGVSKFNLGDAVNSLKWDGVDLLITGVVEAIDGGSIGGWTINSNSLVSPNEQITLDSENQWIQVENADGSNWLRMDGEGLFAYDSTFGTTVSIPTDGTAPTFSSGTIKEMEYELYTSGVIRTNTDPATNGGVLVNPTGIHVYNSSGQRTAFLDAEDSNHEFSGTLTISDWSTDVSGSGVPDANADVTANNTANDTANVGGTSSSTVLANIQTALTDSSNAQATADGKIESFYQASAPASGMSEGDLWIDTDDSNKLYRYSGSSWVSIQDGDITAAQSTASTAITNAATAQATADGKVATFYASSTPTADGVGDLWYNNSNYALNRWSGSSWVAVGSRDALSLVNGPAEANADTTNGALSSGLTLTSGYIKRGTNEILIDFSNRRQAIGGEAYKSTGIQFEYNGGSPRAHIGDGDARYIEFDGNDVVLGEDTILRGAPSIADDDSIYFESFVESLDGYDVVGDVDITLPKQGVYISTATTTSGDTSSFSLRKLDSGGSWNKRRRAVFTINTNVSLGQDNKYSWLGLGSFYNGASAVNFVGFQIDFSRGSGWIRGLVHPTRGSTIYQESWSGDHASDQLQTIKLSVHYDPVIEQAEFFVNGVTIGSLSTSTIDKSSTVTSDYFVYVALENSSTAIAGAGSSLVLKRYKFWQEG
jgi:hypothetical protein